MSMLETVVGKAKFPELCGALEQRFLAQVEEDAIVEIAELRDKLQYLEELLKDTILDRETDNEY